MIKVHDKATRGRTRGGLLDSYHTFSFGGFSDPSRMGFGALRVINEDRLIPGGGFAPHDHADMDILTLVLDGHLRHEDDQGNVALIGPGDVQGMSAGSGVRHSEFNASDTVSAHFLQIWLLPDQAGGAPAYSQTRIPDEREVLLAGPAHRKPLIPLRSGNSVTQRTFSEGETLVLPVTPGRDRFLHLTDGLAMAETERVSAGDGLEIPGEEELALTWKGDGTVLIFDMPRRTKPVPRPEDSAFTKAQPA